MKKEKTFFTLVISIVGIMVLFIAVLAATFRYMGLQSAESKANLAAHIVQESLTSHMMTGSAEYQNELLKQIDALEGMKRTWIVRSEALSAQYGRGIYPQD